MAIDNKSVLVSPLPEEPPQTIPELYLRLTEVFDFWSDTLRKGFREIKLDLPEVEMQRDEERELSSVDLQRHVDQLQREVSLMNKRFEWQESEIAYLKKALRDLEGKVDFPPAATFCPSCGTAFKTESSLRSKNTKAYQSHSLPLPATTQDTHE